MSDLISRAEAMDASEKFIKDCNPDHFVGHQKFIEYMDNAEIGSFGKWQFANGFNMGLTAAEVAIKKLPSAQPEPKWVPCRVRLPKKTDLYYVTIRDEDGTEYTSCMCYYINLARWEVDVNVIAWLPDPEPYKEGE